MYISIHQTILSMLLLYSAFTACHADTPPPFKLMQFTRTPSNAVVLEGAQVMLPCSATYDGNSPSAYSWKRNYQLLEIWNLDKDKTRYILANGSLFFPSVTATEWNQDIASYQCIAEKTESDKVHRIITPQVELSLASSPMMTSQPEDLHLLAGETAMFRCDVVSKPKATYRWTHNRARVIPSSRILLHSNGEVLEVRSVNRTDVGLYRCRAENMAGHVQSSSAALTVVSRSTEDHLGTDFVMRPWDTSVTRGSAVTLFCAVNGTDSNRNQPTVTWLKSGSTVDTSAAGGRISITGSASLQILNASLEDDGIYTCRGENLEAVSDAAARLSVKVPPYFITVPRNTYGRANEDIVLYCEVGGTPAPRVTWLKDSEVVTDSQYFRYVGHNLEIMGLMPTDAAYYQCMAENDLATVYAVAQLIIIDTDTVIPDEQTDSFTSQPAGSEPAGSTDKPLAPTNLQAMIVSLTYVGLSWSGSSTGSIYSVSIKESQASRVRVANTSMQEYVAQGLVANTEYIFAVRSINSNGYSEDKAEIVVSTQALLAVPQAVENMRAWATSEESIAVTWEPPLVTNGAVTNYRIYFGDHYMQTNSTSMTLSDLHPYKEYYIKVVASNKNGQGTHHSEKAVRTFSAKPSAAPTNVTLDVSGATTIAVRWTPPPETDMNGVITGYKIRCKRKDRDNRAEAHITDADARSYEIDELEAGVTYQIRIAALNINGTGEYTPWLESTTYAVELDETRPPGKPSYIQLKAFSKEMIVSWGSTEDSDEVVVRGFKIGYGIGIPEDLWVGQISPSTRIYSLDNLLPQNHYVVQVMAYNSAGTGPSAQQLAITTESVRRTSELQPPVGVNATVISPTSVILTWYDKALSKNQEPIAGRIYTVKYNALTSSAQRKTVFTNTTELVLVISGLRPFTSYEFSVMVSEGSRVSFYSMSIRNTTFESVPNSPPRDLTVNLIENKPNMLMISWQPPSIPNGRIVSYTIYSSTNYNQPLHSWIVEEVEGDQLNHEFGPVTTSTLYFFRMAAHNSKGASPASATVTLNTPKMFEVVNSGTGSHELPGPKNLGASQNVSPTSSTGNGVPSAQTLWIVIAIVSAITVFAIAALVIVMCRRRILSDRRKPANLKATNQAPKGMNKNNKQNPNLWIDHEQVEMKALNKDMETPDVVDESTSMLHSQGSNFDVPSMVGDGYTHIDEPRYCTLGRQRPAIVAPYQRHEAMPRATVQPMISENGRPLYPRTQFAAHHPGNIPRVNLGDGSQPVTEIYGSYAGIETSSFCTDPLTGLTAVSTTLVNGAFTNGEIEPYNHVSPPPYYNKPYMVNGEEIPPPRPPPMENRPQPLRFKNTNGTGHTIPKHIVKPQPMTFKPAVLSPNEDAGADTDSLKRPPRPPYANRQLSQGSLSKDSLKMSLKTGSTEQLNTDMANLDNLMQDLNCIT